MRAEPRSYLKDRNIQLQPRLHQCHILTLTSLPERALKHKLSQTERVETPLRWLLTPLKAKLPHITHIFKDAHRTQFLDPPESSVSFNRRPSTCILQRGFLHLSDLDQPPFHAQRFASAPQPCSLSGFLAVALTQAAKKKAVNFPAPAPWPSPSGPPLRTGRAAPRR